MQSICKLEEEEGRLYGQIDGDSGGGKLEGLSPFFTKLKGRLVLSNKKSLNLCFQLSGGSGGVTEPAVLLV